MKGLLYAVRCLKSNEDMILALAGQFKQLSHEPEFFLWVVYTQGYVVNSAVIISMPLWVVYTQGYVVNSAVIISMPLWVVYTQGYLVNSAVIISMPLWVVYAQGCLVNSAVIISLPLWVWVVYTQGYVVNHPHASFEYIWKKKCNLLRHQFAVITSRRKLLFLISIS